MKLVNFLKNFVREEDGVTAVEYALVLGLVVLGLIGAAGLLEDSISAELGQLGTVVGRLITP